MQHHPCTIINEQPKCEVTDFYQESKSKVTTVSVADSTGYTSMRVPFVAKIVKGFFVCLNRSVAAWILCTMLKRKARFGYCEGMVVYYEQL